MKNGRRRPNPQRRCSRPGARRSRSPPCPLPTRAAGTWRRRPSSVRVSTGKPSRCSTNSVKARRQPRCSPRGAVRCWGLGSSAAALADCQYALRLKPAAAIPSALYGQALAEERIGATRAAITHFRDFAALSAPPEQRNEALRRAGALEASLAPPPAPPAPRQPSPGPAVRVVVAPPGSSQRGCGNHLDCGHGGWCKDRGDGLKVCMDSGEHGDACQSSIDCGSGGFCRDRGDGMKVCMSHGGAGAPCSTSIDCGGGLFCRGGTIKTCQ